MTAAPAPARPPPGYRRPRHAINPLLRPIPSTLAPGLHYLGGLAPSAGYVVETMDGLVLIDSGLAADAIPVLRQFEELHLDPSQIRIILLTHSHADHTMGARFLSELSGAEIHIGAADAPALREGAPLVAFTSIYEMPGLVLHETPVDVELEGGELIELGRTRILAIATPGHTAGSMCFLMRRAGITALFAGDTVMSMTKLGTYTAYHPPMYGGDAYAYIDTFRTLLDLPPPGYLLPGHPRSDRQAWSAKITEERWRGLLEAGIAEMERLNEVAERGGAGAAAAPRRGPGNSTHVKIGY